MERINILIYGGGLQGLSVAKSLKDCSYEVIILCDERQFNHYKYVDKVIRLKGLTKEKRDWR